MPPPPWDGGKFRLGLTPPPPPPGNPPPKEIPLIPIAIGFIASLLFAILLARHLSKPIVSLRNAFRAVASGNFEVSLANKMPGWQDELADLGRDFDNTARQLKQLLSSQRRLLHDVSHEVRSPLARMQLAIDLLRQQPERALETIERVERESARINLLMEELLTLSRLEARTLGALDSEVDMVEVVGEVVADACFEAEAMNRRVEFEAPDSAKIRGRTDLLFRALENVIRNALRHTFAGTAVHVSIKANEAEVRIKVEDDGPGIPEGALEAIFEPFVRFEAARGAEGFGLGLAIAREVIDVHGGHIRAYNRDEGGLCMEVALPRAKSAHHD